MKNSDLKRFYETDASENNKGFARLDESGKLAVPVASNKIDTGNAVDGKLMAANGQGGVKFVDASSGGGGAKFTVADPYALTSEQCASLQFGDMVAFDEVESVQNVLGIVNNKGDDWFDIFVMAGTKIYDISYSLNDTTWECQGITYTYYLLPEFPGTAEDGDAFNLQAVYDADPALENPFNLDWSKPSNIKFSVSGYDGLTDAQCEALEPGDMVRFVTREEDPAIGIVCLKSNSELYLVITTMYGDVRALTYTGSHGEWTYGTLNKYYTLPPFPTEPETGDSWNLKCTYNGSNFELSWSYIQSPS